MCVDSIQGIGIPTDGISRNGELQAPANSPFGTESGAINEVK